MDKALYNVVRQTVSAPWTFPVHIKKMDYICFFTFQGCFQWISQLPFFSVFIQNPRLERWDLVTPNEKSTGISCLFFFSLGDVWQLNNQAAMRGLYHHFFP